MNSYMFGLVVSGAITDEMTDAIFEVAPESTVLTDRDGTGGLIEFEIEDAEASNSLEVIQDAIARIEEIGLTVERVEPDELVYASDIAERIGRSRQSVDHLIRGIRGPGDFPRPFTHAATRNPMWRWTDVKPWFDAYEGKPTDDEGLLLARTIALVNANLEERRHFPHIRHFGLKNVKVLDGSSIKLIDMGAIFKDDITHIAKLVGGEIVVESESETKTRRR